MHKAIQFVEFKKIFNFFPNDLVGLYLRSSNADWVKINPSFLDDNRFSLIDDEGKAIGDSPILTYNELLLVVPDFQAPNDSQIKTIASSFKKELLSKNDKQKSIILNYLIDSMKLFKIGSRFYAPFVTICQSSGVGKSRFVLECGEDIPLVYGVFRAASDKSYPPMSDWIKLFTKYVLEAPIDSVPINIQYDNLNAESYSVGRVLVFINAVIAAYVELFNRLKSSDYSIPNVLKEINFRFHTLAGHAEFEELVWDKLKNLTDITPKITFVQVFERIRSILKSLYPDMKTEYKNAPFVIVFDELSLLLEIDFPNHINLFHIIRRALHMLPFDNPLDLLIVGIGTNGDVSIFHKEVSDDSLRFLNKNLFLPSLVLGSNWDIFKKFIDLNNFKLTPRNVKNTKMIKLLCSFGRALWSSLPFGDILTVALQKLRNGSSSIFYTVLAFWSIRTGLSLNSDMVIARTLLRSYMAIAYSISYNSENMNIGYPSEPILAIVARDSANNNELFSLKNMLSELLEFVQLRPVDKGEITEAIFTQIILMAIDKSENFASKDNYDISVNIEDFQLKQIFDAEVFLLEKRPDKVSISEMNVEPSTPSTASDYTRPSIIQNYYHITTVESFLKSLYGDIRGQEISNALGDRLRCGIINATHVISSLRNFPYQKVYSNSEINTFLDKSGYSIPEMEGANEEVRRKSGETEGIIDQSILRNFFLRQAALKTPPGYYGLDMCIPVLMKRSSAEEEEGLFGYIGIQYKTTYESEMKVIEKMDPKLHYLRCGAHKNCTGLVEVKTDEGENIIKECEIKTKPEDLEIIFKNHLMLYLSASYEKEKKISVSIGDDTRKRSDRISRNNIKKIVEEISEKDNVDVAFYNGIPYFVTNSISELAANNSKILDQPCIELIQRVIHAHNDPFKSVEEFQNRKVADNVLTMSPLRYLGADGDLRASRGLEPLPDLFSNIKEEWSNVNSIKAYIDNAFSGQKKKQLR